MRYITKTKHLVRCIAILCYIIFNTSCADLPKYHFVVYDWGPMDVILTKDSICQFMDDGAITVWTQIGDSILIPQELVRNENNEVESHVRENREQKIGINQNLDTHRYKSSIKYPKNKVAQKRIKAMMKGDFELRVGDFFYKTYAPHPIALFNSSDRHKQYRRVNGIRDRSFTITRNPIDYDFKYGFNQRSLSESGDTLPPFWCRGQFPHGIKTLIIPTERDVIIDYGDNQWLWINIAPNLDNQGLFYPVDITKETARVCIEKNFPLTHRFVDLKEIKNKLLLGLERSNVLKRTNKCIIIASGIKSENMPMFNALLTNCFVEEDPGLMTMLYTSYANRATEQPLETKYFDEKYNNPEMIDLIMQYVYMFGFEETIYRP